jgi:long-chain fatty acid transport protein
MKTKLSGSFTKTLLAVGLASASSFSHAGSFGLIENSASGQGSAFAGAAALGEDASTVYFNPAAMTRLSGSQIVVAGHIISPNADYKDKGSTDAAGQPLSGKNDSVGDPAFIPNLYYVTELSNDIHVGVGINVPFGLSTEYSSNWVGRYHAVDSELETINVNPSIAWKATKNFSVGFGINIQYLDIKLTNHIDSFAACSSLASPAACAGAGLNPVLGDRSQDSKVDFRGDSLELGWNAGFLYDINDTNRVGIAYRSTIKHKVSGDDAKYKLNDVLQVFADGATAATGFNILQTTSLKSTAELPNSLSLSYVSEFTPKWTGLFDYTWTGWNTLQDVVIRQKGGPPGRDPTLELEYTNTNRVSAGLNYQLDERIILRTGVAWDQTPIKTKKTTTARIPGNDRKWLSVGAGYEMSNTWTFDVAYSHLFLDNTKIESNTGSASSGATLLGRYKSDVNIFSAQANYNF